MAKQVSMLFSLLAELADAEEDENEDADSSSDDEEAECDVDGEEQDEADEPDELEASDDGEAEEDEEDEADVDEEPDQSFPRECHCGATLEDSLELAIHRTEEHGVPQAALGHLEAGEFESIVREAEDLQDVIDEVGWSSEKTLRVIGLYELGDALGRGDDAGVDEEPTTTDGGPEADDADPAPVEEHTEEPVEADSETLDLAAHGTSRGELVDAIEGAQTVHHVQRDLGLDRETTTDLLEAVGLLEKIATGCPPIEPSEAATAVKEVA